MTLTFKFIKFIAALTYIFVPTFFIVKYLVLNHFPEIGESGGFVFILSLFICLFFAATLADFVKWYENKQQKGD